MIGIGNYKLRKSFQCLLQDMDSVRIPESYDPKDIVNIVQNTFKDILTTVEDKEKYKTDQSQVIPLQLWRRNPHHQQNLKAWTKQSSELRKVQNQL